MTARPAAEPLEPRRLLADFTPFDLSGEGFDGNVRLALAPDGTVTAAGLFAGTVDFAPGPSDVTRQARGPTDAFVARYTPSGRLLWVTTFGGDEEYDELELDDFDDADGVFGFDDLDFGFAPERQQLLPLGPGRALNGAQEFLTDVAVGPDGDAYVTGAFRETIQIAGATIDTGDSEEEFFDGLLLRLDGDTGEIGYISQIRGPFDEVATSVAYRADGVLAVGGSFARRATFSDARDPFEFSPLGREDGFVALYNAADGGIIDVAAVGSDADAPAEREQVTDLALTPDGGVAAVGIFAEEADFDPGDGEAVVDAVGETDAFALKLDAGLGYEWVTTAGGEEYDGDLGVAVGPDGSVHTVGYFQEAVDVLPNDPESFLFANTRLDRDHTDLLLRRLTPDGDLVWAKSLSGTGFETVGDLAVDSRGVLTLVGGFFGRLDVSPSPTDVILTSIRDDDDFDERDTNTRDEQSYDVFAVQLSPRGLYVSSYQAGSRADDALTGIAIDEARGKIYVAGRYGANRGRSTIDLNSGPRRLLFDTTENATSIFFTLGLDTLTLV